MIVSSLEQKWHHIRETSSTFLRSMLQSIQLWPIERRLYKQLCNSTSCTVWYMYSQVAANRETNSTTCTMLNVYFWEVWCTQYVQLQLIERPLVPLVQCPISEKYTVQSSCGLIERPLLTLLAWCIYTVQLRLQLRLIERPPSWPERFWTAPPKYTSLGPLQHHQLLKQARHAFNEGDPTGSTVPNILYKTLRLCKTHKH